MTCVLSNNYSSIVTSAHCLRPNFVTCYCDKLSEHHLLLDIMLLVFIGLIYLNKLLKKVIDA